MASTCINVAIIPTESLVGSARTLLTCRHAGTMGVRVDGAPAYLDLLRGHTESGCRRHVAAHPEDVK